MSFILPQVSRAQNVLTQHNDLSRSGANPNETILTTSNVRESTFGKLFSLPIDGFTYAQPLYYAGVSIAGGTHNVLYVATAHDSVYAFDADTGTQYWKVSLGTPVPSSVIGTQNILVEVGIIATPVIDPSSGTIYVTAKTYESGVQIFRLHALNISTGAEKFGGPVEVSAASFNAAKENQRAALTLANGVVYLAFASHEDFTPYHGFVLGYSASTLTQVQVFNVTPNSGQGAIWMGGQGFVVDSSNNLYLVTSNSTQSTENAANDYGESFLKLVPNGNSLTVADYFKANQYDSWNAADTDLGSTGAFAIPGTSYIAGGSKSGQFFVVNTNNMGKLDLSSNQVVQEFQATNGLWGNPAFFNDVMYIWGVNEPLKAYQWNGGSFSTSPSSQSAYTPPGGTTSGTVSVSSNGTTAGTTIVWATSPTGDPDHNTVGGNLYAYDATNLSSLLWSTSSNPSRDSYGSFAKFCAPTIANGKVYMGTDSEHVVVYGLLSVAPGFRVSPSSSALTVVQGSSATDTISVTDVGTFAGSVTLSATNLPSGVTATFAPNPTTGSSAVTFTASGTAATGTSTVTITGTSGSLTATIGIAVTVTTMSGSNLIANGTYIITAVNSGLAIDDPGHSATAGEDMEIYTVNDGTNQQWKVNNVSTNVITLTNVSSGQLLAVAGGSTAAEARVDQFPANGATYEEWNVISVGSGIFELTNVNSGLALDVVGGGTTNKTAIDQYTYGGRTWQQWKFTSF